MRATTAWKLIVAAFIALAIWRIGQLWPNAGQTRQVWQPTETAPMHCPERASCVAQQDGRTCWHESGAEKWRCEK